MVSALAASIAIAAMYMGSKNKNNNGPKHGLHGTLKRRMGLFSRMADRTSCATCRSEKAVIEQDDFTTTDYRLA